MYYLHRHAALFLGLLCFSLSSYSTVLNPAYAPVFMQDEVSIIEIEMDDDDKQLLIHPANVTLDTYYTASIRFVNSIIDTTIENAGIRIRGNTSRNNPKKSFKIDFKEFGGDQFYKLKKLNLKPNNNDPSQMREYLTTLVYRELEVPVARAGYSEVYINNEYMGIYLNVENIDDEFIDRRFGNEEGNLYKCRWGTTLEKSINAYDPDFFELKTNETINDRSKLEELINLLNEKDDGNWNEAIQTIFDVDLYLRQLAVEAMVGHWDGYSYNINNFYLYENPETGKIVFVPYDMDNTWGIDWVGRDWAKRDLLHWSSDYFKTPLTTRILAIPEFNDRYITYLYEVIAFLKSQDYFYSTVNDLFDLLSTSIEEDSYYPLTFGYSSDNFFESYETAFGGHVDYGIWNYIDTRIAYAEKQLPERNAVESIKGTNFAVYPNPMKGNHLTLSGAGSINSTISIYDSWGKPINYTIDEAHRTLTFGQELLPGLYILKSGVETRRFVVGR
jgi:hypothetical protein